MRKKNEYEQFLLSKLKDTHIQYHSLEEQLINQKKNNAKLLKDISSLRKKENDNKLTIKKMKSKIEQLEMIVNSTKNPPPRKPALQKGNMLCPSNSKEKIEVIPKQAFKEFLSQNFPHYKDTVKKAIALVLYFERHWAKTDIERVQTYHSLISRGINKFLQFILPSTGSWANITRKSTEEQNIATNLIKQWHNTDSKMKEILYERNKYKTLQDEYLEKIQRLEASEARLMIAKKMLQAKNYSYQFTLKAKAAQFVSHLKKVLIQKQKVIKDYEELDEENFQKFTKQIKQILAVMQQVSQKQIKSLNDQNYKLDKDSLQKDQEKKDKNKFAITSYGNRSTSKALNSSSGPAPTIKKNIFGYYQTPQLLNNKPSLQKTIPYRAHTNKSIQTTPDDHRLLLRYPVLLLNIIDGRVRTVQNRHRLDFYVRICNIEPQLLLKNQFKETTKFANRKYVDTTVKQGYQPVWNQKMLIKDYTYPFLYFQLMNVSKLSSVDEYIATGKIQVTETQTAKEVIMRNETKQYQGKIRLELVYPKCTVYLFTINSVKLVYPEEQRMLKQTVVLNFPFNPKCYIEFAVGQKIVYLGGQTYQKNTRYYNNNEFLIMPGYQGAQIDNCLKVKLKQSKKIGAKPIVEQSLWTQENSQGSESNKQIIIKMKGNHDWQVILQGSILTIFSENDSPQKIDDETDEFSNQNERMYISLQAAYPIINVHYNNIILPSHIKLPLIFKYAEEQNNLTILRINQEELKQNNQQQQKIEPLVTENNIISQSAIESISLSAPKIVYKIYIKTIQAPSDIKIANSMYYYEKMLDKLELCYVKDSEQHKQESAMKKKDDHIKKFVVFTKQLVQNYYITMTKMFGRHQFIRFKIGYARYENLLKMPEFGDKNLDDNQIVDSDIQEINEEETTGQAFVTIMVKDGRFPTFSSTSNYQILFIRNSTLEEKAEDLNILNKKIFSKLSKSLNGRPTWNESLILPYKTPMSLQIIEHTVFGNQKIIYERKNFQVGALQIKLNKLFINIPSPNEIQGISLNQDYIQISNIKELLSLYKVKINQLHAEIEEESDWIGKIDPYIKFYDPELSTDFYETKILDGIGNSPTWNNDQFQSLVALNKFQCTIYDKDMIGKDDYLGISYFNIQSALESKYNKKTDHKINIMKNNNLYVKQLTAPIRKEEKQCGKLQLFGEFKKIGGCPIKHKTPNYSSNIDKVYRVNVFGIAINNQYMDSSEAYLEFHDENNPIYTKRSFSFFLQGRPSVDFQVWPKYINEKQKNSSLKLYLHRKIKNLFSQTDEVLGECKLLLPKKQNTTIHFLKSQISLYSQKGNTFIGNLYYLIEEISQINCLVVEGTTILQSDNQEKEEKQNVGEAYCNRKYGGAIIVSDIGDTLVIGDQFAVKNSDSKPQQLPKLLFYRDNWNIVHPKNKINNNAVLKLELESQNYFGKVFNIIQKQYDILYGALLAHTFEYTRSIKAKTEQHTHQQSEPQNYLMTHLYFSSMDQPFLQNFKLFSSQDSDSKQYIEKLKNIILIFSIEETADQDQSDVIFEKYERSLISLMKISQNSYNEEQNNNFYISLPRSTSKSLSISVSVQICQRIIQGEKSSKNIILQKQKLILCKQNENNDEQKKMFAFGKVIKFDGLKYCFSCEFVQIPDNLGKGQKQNSQNFKQLHIPWLYIELFAQIPYNQSKNLLKTIKKLQKQQNSLNLTIRSPRNIVNNDWKYDVCVPVHFSKENILASAVQKALNDEHQIISGSYSHRKGQAIINNRSILIRHLRILLPTYYHKRLNQTTKLEFSVSIINSQAKDYLTKNVVIQISTEETKNKYKPIVESLKAYNQLEDVADKYYVLLNYSKISMHGQYRIIDKKVFNPNLNSKSTKTKMQIVKMDEIFISINKFITNQFHSSAFQDFIQLHFIEPQSKCKTVCRVPIREHQEQRNKQYLLVHDQKSNDNVILFPDYQYLKDNDKNKEQQIQVEVWSGVKIGKGLISHVNKSQLIGKAICLFNHHRVNDFANLMIELKGVQKKNMSVGKLILKYQYQYKESTMVNTCQEFYVDKICAENAKELTYNNLRIHYYQKNSNIENSQQGAITKFKHYLSAKPSPANQQQQAYKNMAVYELNVPLLLSSIYTSPVKIQIYRYSVVSQKETLVCELSNLNVYTNQGSQIFENKNLGRWSQEVKLGNITKMIIAGSISPALTLPFSSENVQNINPDTKAKEPAYIQLTLNNFHHLCSEKGSLTLAIENGNCTLQTKSLEFTNEQQFTCKFILNRDQCDFLRIHVLSEKKKQILYTSQQIDYKKISGVISFYVAYTSEQFVKIFMGACVWSVKVVNHQYFEPVSMISKTLGMLNLGNFLQEKQSHYLIELTRTTLETFIDSEYFSEMNPYLEINDLYATTVGVGRQQLFWKLGITLPIYSQSTSDSVKVVVKDKDMFYDDYVGTATMNLSQVITKYQKDKLENLQVNLEQRADIPVFDMNKESRQTGHIKLHYRIIEVPQHQEGIKRPEMVTPQICVLSMKLNFNQLYKYFQDNHPKIFKDMSSKQNVNQQLIKFKIHRLAENKKIEAISSLALNFMQGPVDQIPLSDTHIQMTYAFNNNFQHLKKYLQQFSKGVQYYASISNNNEYMKEPLEIKVNLPVPELSTLSYLKSINNEEIKNPDKIKQCVVLNDLKFLFSGPKFNKFSSNVKIMAFTNFQISQIYPGAKGSAKMSSSKYSPQIVQLCLSQQSQNMEKSIILDVKNIGEICKNEEEQIMRLVMNDQQTGFTCALSLSRKDIKSGHLYKSSHKNIAICQVYQNYHGIKKNKSSANKIGSAYLQLTHMILQQSENILENISTRQAVQNLRNIGDLAQRTSFVKIMIKYANLQKDIEILGKMDPYCKIFRSDALSKQFKQVHQTQTQQNKGKQPVWNQCFYVERSANKSKPLQLYFKIMDQQVTIDRGVAQGYILIEESELSQEITGEKVEKIISLHQYKKQFPLAIGKQKENNEFGKLALKIWQYNPLYIVFVNICYFDLKHAKNDNYQLYLHEIGDQQGGQTCRLIILGDYYPILLNENIAVTTKTKLNIQQNQQIVYNTKMLVEQCHTIQNKLTLFNEGIQLDYFIIL